MLHKHNGHTLPHIQSFQQALTLEEKKQYASYVKTLKWTLVFDNGLGFGDLPFMPTYSATQPLGLWTIFKALTEVTSVEFTEWYPCRQFHHYTPKDIYLFPKVVSISFQGYLIDTFAKYILPSTKASQLEYLRLEHFKPAGAGQSVTETTIQFLRGLLGKCTRLRSLTVIDDLLYLGGDPEVLWPVHVDFIDSVRGTLEILHFESKTDMWPTESRSNNTSPGPGLSEISNKVRQVLIRGTWPCLRKATVLP